MLGRSAEAGSVGETLDLMMEKREFMINVSSLIRKWARNQSEASMG